MSDEAVGENSGGVSLTGGWNLISLPIVPFDTSIESVLAPLTFPYDLISVWYYDCYEDEWLVYGNGYTSLETMEDGKAYWINMIAGGNLTAVGQAVAPPGYGPPPPTYDVVEGWNMIGFRSMNPMKAEEYLMGTEYVRIYGFDLDQGGWFSLPYSNNMTPDLGYWIAFSEEGTIYP